MKSSTPLLAILYDQLVKDNLSRRARQGDNIDIVKEADKLDDTIMEASKARMLMMRAHQTTGDHQQHSMWTTR